MKTRHVLVNDRMQQDYAYVLTAPTGRDFHRDFKPQLSPKEMLKVGVFGGKYMTDCTDEFPADWFENAKLCATRHEPTLNCFGINASQSLSIWRSKGWIHADDPRGWFQWYCRYYIGRRGDDDARQVKRWRAVTRHLAQITKNCRRGDLLCRPRQRQALLHWAYDTRRM